MKNVDFVFIHNLEDVKVFHLRAPINMYHASDFVIEHSRTKLKIVKNRTSLETNEPSVNFIQEVYQGLPDFYKCHENYIPEYLQLEIDIILNFCDEIGLEIYDTYFKIYSKNGCTYNKYVIDFGNCQIQINNIQSGMWNFLHPTKTILNINPLDLKGILVKEILQLVKNNVYS